MKHSSQTAAGGTHPLVGADRVERRKARTRTALLRAAQQFLAEGRTNVPILAITDAADVGLGSFYNHFGAREDLFRAAVLDALDVHGTALDQLTAGIADPAEAFATSFRLTGRFHRLAPQLSRVVLHNGLDHLGADQGLAPRARRDINAALTRGRFRVADIDVAMVLVGGAALALGRFLHDHPEADDARATDEVTEHLLVALGIDPDEARRLSQTPLPDLTEAVRR